MYEKLLKAGADVINGGVFLNHVLMGTCTNDGFVLTAEGELWSRPKRARAAQPDPEPAPDPAPPPQTE